MYTKRSSCPTIKNIRKNVLGLPLTFSYHFFTLPDGPPMSVSEDKATTTTIIVKWQPPPVGQQNGVILGYRINYTIIHAARRRKRDDHVPESDIRSVVVGPDVFVREINNLKKFTTYRITVAAFNPKGIGPFSQEMIVSTDEDGR